jgi:16S rRNA (guanine966-N2)-methyltransferase
VARPGQAGWAVTRIVAGVARGRRLAVPRGQLTRPTSDRAREGLFGTIIAIRGRLAGAGVLDLYAGSGAIGLEALSRGAARAVLVESDPRAAGTIRANLAATGLPGGRVVCDRVERFLGRGPGPEPPADLVVADPPYAATGEEVTWMLTALVSGGWLAGGALVAVERATRGPAVTWPGGYIQDRSRRYGEATFWYGLAAAQAS